MSQNCWGTFIGSFLYSNQNVVSFKKKKKRGAIVVGSDCCVVFAVLPCWGGRTGSVHRGKFLLHTLTWTQNTHLIFFFFFFKLCCPILIIVLIIRPKYLLIFGVYTKIFKSKFSTFKS